MNMEKVAFDIIVDAGQAKEHALKAIDLADENKFDEAKKLIADANKQIAAASKHHFEVIAAEADGKKVELSVLFMHAEDQLLSTQTLIILAEKIIKLHKKIKS